MSLAGLFRFFAAACGFLAAVEVGLAVWAVRTDHMTLAAGFLIVALATFAVGWIFAVFGRQAEQLRIP